MTPKKSLLSVSDIFSPLTLSWTVSHSWNGCSQCSFHNPFASSLRHLPSAQSSELSMCLPHQGPSQEAPH
jgi:hypothetical protein